MTNKINGKFYPLQHQEWVQACKTLTKSQLSVLLYLRTLDPYSNGIRVKSSKIAADLGITKRSVNAAIAALAERHLIEIEDAEYQLKISSRGRLCQSEPSVTQVGNQFPTEENHFPPEKTISHSSTEFPTEENHFPPEKTISQQESETPTPSDFQEPKTLKTIQNKKTLSEAREREFDVCLNKIPKVDREKFLIFARSKAAQLPDPPQLVEKWIATHIDWIKQEFDKTYSQNPLPTGEDTGSAAASTDKFFEELHPAVKEGLSSGEISRLDRAYHGLYDSQGNWWKIDDWLDRDESRCATARTAARAAIAALRQRFSTRREV